MAIKALRQQPGPDMDAGAWIVQIVLVNAVPRQGAQVRAVNLHQPDVIGAGTRNVGTIDRLRIQPRLDAGDCVQQIGRHAIALRGLFPAGERTRGRAEQKNQSGRWITSHRSPQ